MKNHVALKEILSAVESVQAEHLVTQNKLVAIRKALNLLEPEAAIKLQAGKVMPHGWINIAGHICKPK